MTVVVLIRRQPFEGVIVDEGVGEFQYCVQRLATGAQELDQPTERSFSVIISTRDSKAALNYGHTVSNHPNSWVLKQAVAAYLNLQVYYCRSTICPSLNFRG